MSGTNFQSLLSLTRNGFPIPLGPLALSTPDSLTLEVSGLVAAHAVPGEYVLTCQLNLVQKRSSGRTGASAPAFVWSVEDDNLAPVAVAGPDLVVNSPGEYALDALGSYDPDGDSLTYQWLGGGLTLMDAMTVAPMLTVEEGVPPGSYEVILIVSDGAIVATDVVIVIVETFCLNDQDGDGICDEDEVPGCTVSGACNFDPNATEDDGSCDLLSCLGCTDPQACDFDPEATQDDGSCQYPEEDYLDCGGGCLNDADVDGICDEIEVIGCTYADACNFNPVATHDDGSCYFPSDGEDCSGQCFEDADADGVCDAFEIPGCTAPAATNFHPAATEDDGSCDFEPLEPCEGDINGDNIVSVADLLIMLSDFGYTCDCLGQPQGTCDCDGTMPDALGVCGGSCMADVDGDGVCDDVDDCVGTYDECGTCNGPGPVLDCGCMDIPEGDCDCEGNQLDAEGNCGEVCVTDLDSDGVCDNVEQLGCIYSESCNYDDSATNDDGSCVFPGDGVDCNGDCLLDVDQDGNCDVAEVLGCTVPWAVNYHVYSTVDDGSCVYNVTSSCPSDLSGDGTVTIQDVLIVLSLWDTVCD